MNLPDALRQRPGTWLGALAVTAAGALLLHPILARPTTHVLGTWDSEAAWHIWRHAAWLRTFAAEGPWQRAHEDGLLDPDLANLFPASTLLSWPAWLAAGGGTAGVALAWNALFAIAFVGAVAGTWAFVRAWLPNDQTRLAAAAATTIVAFGAFLHQAPGVGRIENVHQLLWPLHLAFLYRATVSSRRPADAVLAAGSFGLLAMQGGFPALLTALVEVPVALWCLAQSGARRHALAVLAVVAVAGAAALWPWVEANRLYPPPSLAVGREGIISVPLAQLLPGGGDVPFARGWHEAPYPGFVALLAAVGAALFHRASRFWLLLALAVMALMIGPEARWTFDGPVLAAMPVSWLERIPGWSVPSTGWARLGTFVPTLLACAIVPALAGRPRLAALVALLAIADQVAYVRSVPRAEAAWELAEPDTLTAPTAPTVWLPYDERALTWLHAADAPRRRYPFSQRGDLPTLRWVDEVLPGTPEGFRRQKAQRTATESAPLPGCVERDAGVLADAGFTRLVLLNDHGDAREVEAVLRAGLGEPVAVTERGAAWNLASAPLATCDTVVGPAPVVERRQRGTPTHRGGGLKKQGRGRRREGGQAEATPGAPPR